jgi:transcription elongation factor GreA
VSRLQEDAVSETYYVSRKTYEKLRSDLDNLKKIKAELSEEIGEAARQGDLKENAEYIAAKERQTETLAKINELEIRLRNSRITDDLDVDKSEARIGATIVIEDLEDGEKTAYTLVGSMESNPDKGLLSVKAPVATALLGKKEGDEFEVVLPRSKRKYKLVKLEYK